MRLKRGVIQPQIKRSRLGAVLLRGFACPGGSSNAESSVFFNYAFAFSLFYRLAFYELC